MEFNKKNIKTILLLITFGVVLFTMTQNLGEVFSAVKSIWKVLGTVIAGLCIAFVLNVPLRAFENRVFRRMKQGNNPTLRKLVRPVSMICSIVIAFGIVAILLIVVIPQLSITISELADKLPAYIALAIDWIDGTLTSFNIYTGSLSELTVDWDSAFDNIGSFLREGAGGILGTATDVGASVVSAALDIVFSIIIAIYILAKKEEIGAFTRRCVNCFLPEKAARQVLRIAAMSDETFSNFISGQLMDSCILGVLCYIGMRIFGFPYPEIIAVVIGVTSLVPMVGSFIGEAIGAFLILFVNPLQALLFIVFILCLQQLEGSLIYPKIVGKSVGLPGVLVLCAVIVGSNIAGVFGALLSVPVCAVLFTLLRETLDHSEAKAAPRPKKSV